MSLSTRVTLALLPLAIYSFVMGCWQGGTRPRVVDGPFDVLLLSFGMGGVIAFGPIGSFLVARLFPASNAWSYWTIASFEAILALYWSSRSTRRLLIYNISSEAMDQAVSEALQGSNHAFERTMQGFEDRESGRGIRLESGKWLRCGMLETYGTLAETFTRSLAPRLKPILDREPCPPNPLARAWFGLFGLALAIPSVTILMQIPWVETAVRSVLHRLRGG